MSCIVGLINKNKVYMGADSAGSAGWGLSIRIDRKIFLKSQFIMGFTSSYRMGQILQYELTLPEQPDGMEIFEYMVTCFVKSIRDAFKDGGFAKIENSQESCGQILVGYKSRLFTIDADYQVVENLKPFAAIGCGSMVALGALDATSPRLDPKERIILALSASESWNNGVRAPFHILSTNPKENESE